MHNWVENVRSNQNIWQMENLFQPLSTCLKQQIGWNETWDFTELISGHPQLKNFKYG
jgi:hypothetical protein